MSYNFDQTNQVESFQFILGGHTYNFRYPVTEEVDELFKKKNGDGTPDSEAIMTAVYDYITPADEGAPRIEEALNKSRIPVLKEFQRMVLVEFGLQDA